MPLRALLNVVSADLRQTMGDEWYDEWRDVPEPVAVPGDDDGPARTATPPRTPANRNVSALLAITKTMPREA